MTTYSLDQTRRQVTPRAVWLGFGLALLTALTYVLMGLDLLPVGDLLPEERPAGIILIAAGGYLLGGLLILLRRRWLWLVGLLINGLVMAMFLSLYVNRTAVLFSPGGLISKGLQLLLELTLLFLLVSRLRRRAG